MSHLVWFASRHYEFILPEFESLCTLAGVNVKDVSQETLGVSELLSSPFMHIALPSDGVGKQIAERGILVHGIYELLAEADSYDEVSSAVHESVAADADTV